MKFYLDQDLPSNIAVELRRRRVDVETTAQAGNTHASDREQLAYATRTGRCLVTRNARHFLALAEEAIRRQTAHPGIVLCPPSYRGNEIARIVAKLADIAAKYPDGPGAYAVLYLT